MNLLTLKKHWLQQMASIRFFEEHLATIYSNQIVRCPVHLAIGHEASAVGVCSNLTKEDRVLSYHRSHHHFLAKGGSPSRLLYELLGHQKGCSGGNGGSTHLYDLDNGFVGSSAIISGILPVATGVAHALKLKKTNGIVVCFCGDASVEEGVFFESLNIATLWKLPLLIVIEDNDLSCYTDKKTRQAFKDFSSIAKLFDINYHSADGSNVEEVFNKSQSLIEEIKEHSRPAILHVNVFRAHEHCGPDRDDHLTYRTLENVWPLNDPLKKLQVQLGHEVSEEILQNAHNEVKKLYLNILGELGHAINF
jgi:TPP-dependent pyruvate/acetoin dehydrogenase alpha subunit